MNRRTFFGGVAALCVSPVAPAVSKAPGLHRCIDINCDGRCWPSWPGAQLYVGEAGPELMPCTLYLGDDS